MNGDRGGFNGFVAREDFHPISCLAYVYPKIFFEIEEIEFGLKLSEK